MIGLRSLLNGSLIAAVYVPLAQMVFQGIFEGQILPDDTELQIGVKRTTARFFIKSNCTAPAGDQGIHSHGERLGFEDARLERRWNRNQWRYRQAGSRHAGVCAGRQWRVALCRVELPHRSEQRHRPHRRHRRPLFSYVRLHLRLGEHRRAQV